MTDFCPKTTNINAGPKPSQSSDLDPVLTSWCKAVCGSIRAQKVVNNLARQIVFFNTETHRVALPGKKSTNCPWRLGLGIGSRVVDPHPGLIQRPKGPDPLDPAWIQPL
jgi:hypothetical protein